MLPLVSVNSVGKSFGSQSLFSDLSFSIHSGQRLALIGPNGAGKSTLLKLIAGLEEVDQGEVLSRQGLRISYVAQTKDFSDDISIESLAVRICEDAGVPSEDVFGVVHRSLAALRLADVNESASSLSGGQKKRLQIALALCEEPELLLLDEPTNHLDIDGIKNLERLLSSSSFSWLSVTHDRWFLENTASEILEVNPIFSSGLLRSSGGYRDYLEHRSHLLDSELKQRDSLENKVRTEEAWLRQGAKARSTKSKKRTRDAHAMMADLSAVRNRQRDDKARISFESSGRKTKKLAEFFNVSKEFDGKPVLSSVSMKLMAGQALGVLGENGSGKSTFVRLLSGELTPDSGSVKRADNLELSYFKQFDKNIDPTVSLKEFLSPESDSVVVKGKTVHVSTWAKRFGFSFEQLQQPFEKLSGGEKAKARISRLMLETPDILILDEPTNDLDIPTLEILEESLSLFEGVLVLVTHDRFMINRVCNKFLGITDGGVLKSYADYQQWETDFNSSTPSKLKTSHVAQKAKASRSPKRFSYKEQREYDGMEQAVELAEVGISDLELQIEKTDDTELLQELCSKLGELQSKLEGLFLRWQELEDKKAKFK